MSIFFNWLIACFSLTCQSSAFVDVVKKNRTMKQKRQKKNFKREREREKTRQAEGETKRETFGPQVKLTQVIPRLLFST